jgi:glycosyltransferase involved in cell wall biosynthesis
MKVCICATMVPFTEGGAEIHVESLRRQLVDRGFEAAVVTLPFAFASPQELLHSSMAWRLIDLRTGSGEEVDLVIATRFPSYLIRHPNKVVWLIHQFRQVYDFDGTRFGSFSDSPEDRRVVKMIREMDTRCLQEAGAIFANSRNVARRLKKYNDLSSEPLYHPPKLDGRYRCDQFSDTVFAVGRLDQLKRFDLLIRAMAETSEPVRCRIAGQGLERQRLQELIAGLGLENRVELLGWVDDEQLLAELASSLAVYYAPYDEDFGYVTIEAFRSGKPVLTADDSGGVLEFVEDRVNGFVCSADVPEQMGRCLDDLFRDRDLAARLGAAGREQVAFIGWDRVVERLTGMVSCAPTGRP